MKKHTRLISVLLIMVLVLTSSVMAVFAEGTEPQTDEATVETVEEAAEEVTEEAAEVTGEAVEEVAEDFAEADGDELSVETEGRTAAAEEVTTEATEEPAQETITAPAKPTGFTADTQGKKVVLSWKAVTGATSYIVTVNDKEKTVTGTSYTVSGLKADKANKFKVRAVTKSGDQTAESGNATISWKGVQPVKYTCTVKAACTLRSHKGKKATLKLKKGATVTASNFAAGQYIFEKNGSTFHMNKTRAANPKIVYEKKYNYDPQEVELFVNTSKFKFKSKTKYMVFVSVNTQHLYVFKGKKGNWKYVKGKDWEVSTGKASTPTPTGSFTGSLTLHQKLRTRHGIPYWNCFSSFNAMHGKQKSWKMGKPASGGCVRNEIKNAKWIFENIPLKSKVVIY